MAPRTTQVCYYELLCVDRSAAPDEIRKAYRRKALELHPDKVLHRGEEDISVEDATKRFAEIQHAYEVLSDDNERSWYDAHRHEILRSSSYAAHRAGEGDDDNDELNPDDLSDEYSEGEGGGFSSFFDRGSSSSSGPKKKKAPTGRGIQTSDLMPFFSTSCFESFADTDTSSFFAVYAALFSSIEDEEAEVRNYRLWREKHKRRRGDSDSDSDSDPAWADTTFPARTSFGKSTDGFEYCRAVYDKFTNFTTCKEFRWCDKWRLSEAPDRRVRRAMEKENKKAREVARQEYVSTVRRLATQVRSLDPRYKAHVSAQRERAAEQRAAAEAARKREKQERAERAKTYVAPDWARTDWDEPEALSHDEGAAQGSDGEEEGKYCVACEKGFASARAWKKHVGTKGHKKNEEELARLMREEEEEAAAAGASREAGEEGDGGKKEAAQDDDDDDVFEDAVEELSESMDKARLDDSDSDADAASKQQFGRSDRDRKSKKKKKRRARTVGDDVNVDIEVPKPSPASSRSAESKSKNTARSANPPHPAASVPAPDTTPAVAQPAPEDARRAARMAALRAVMDDDLDVGEDEDEDEQEDEGEQDGRNGRRVGGDTPQRNGKVGRVVTPTDLSAPSSSAGGAGDDSDSSIHREKRGGKKKGRGKKGGGGAGGGGGSAQAQPQPQQPATPTPPPSAAGPQTWRCNVCETEFPTRNQLFGHVKKEGHAVAASAGGAGVMDSGGVEDGGRGKKGKKGRK
ncbi:hypothetical protein M427DRAFT_60070 [Gonapodya prolifera JEL478]|uniref:J domain-containing protein n=1 Tax=Gonapodya prolifera (strain JEL478) TaxID=1344416 RepID=A0A139A536_GONPJ|nr:hypothetical protein M427DRAFT_60070 [Gonapodya prolifera JEL478]|eukprot:KXS11932.1 hypothetical protein M427DRAFT_60070 [Gonapodya prolifera JEL478]